MICQNDQFDFFNTTLKEYSFSSVDSSAMATLEAYLNQARA